MAANTTPIFPLTPHIGIATVSTANTARDGTGTVPTIFTAGANGSKVEEIVVKATGDPADSVVTIFLYDGSTFYLFDEFDIGDPAAASTTVAGYREQRPYRNLVLPTGWSIRAAITVALTSGVINVEVFGGDF
jgi:hypothetical protein